MEQYTVDGFTLTIYPADRPAPAVWLMGERNVSWWNGQYHLLCVSGADWNRDLSPWPAPAVFGTEPFQGGASAFLDTLTKTLVPAGEARLPHPVTERAIAGYSLAGLFAVHAMTLTDVFTRAASVSGSLWFDGWADYAETHPLLPQSPVIYLSLGEREHRTRNPRMATVRERTERMAAHWQAAGVSVTLEWNPGGHFTQPDVRVARAIGTLLAMQACN